MLTLVTQAALLAMVVSLASAAALVLKDRRPLYVRFAGLALSVSAYYLAVYVDALLPAGGLVRVRLQLADGDVLQARITRESVQLLGLEPTVREVVESQRTEAVLLPIGETSVELISPKGNEGLERFLAKRGPGIHHLAIEVEGIEDALGALKALGVPLIDETPRKGARGHKVAFVHPKATGGVLIELVEPDEGHSA